MANMKKLERDYGEILWTGKKPREVKKILDEAVKLERDKYMVRGRDMVGANLHGHGDMGEDNLHSEDFDEMADM